VQWRTALPSSCLRVSRALYPSWLKFWRTHMSRYRRPEHRRSNRLDQWSAILRYKVEHLTVMRSVASFSHVIVCHRHCYYLLSLPCWSDFITNNEVYARSGLTEYPVDGLLAPSCSVWSRCRYVPIYQELTEFCSRHQSCDKKNIFVYFLYHCVFYGMYGLHKVLTDLLPMLPFSWRQITQVWAVS